MINIHNKKTTFHSKGRRSGISTVRTEMIMAGYCVSEFILPHFHITATAYICAFSVALAVEGVFVPCLLKLLFVIFCSFTPA